MIKFRAWKKTKYPEMFNDVAYVDWNNKRIGLNYPLSAETTRLDEDKLENFILMQYTGVKDKNGVEIYEGDIVRYTWDMLSDVNATEKGKKVRISKVFWSDWRASWAVGKKSCNNDLFRYARNGNTVEVIGNIYEQPELLS